MHDGVFVIGADTGIGKTMIACAVAAAAHKLGLRTAVFKPVETGCRREGRRLVGEDVEKLVAAAGGTQGPAEAAGALFETPAAPLAAAAAEGQEISIDRLGDQAGTLIDTHDFTVIEGAGGLLVPIADGVTWLDLIEEFDVPVVCVAGDRLGCVNHTLLTLDRLESEGSEICGFILNRLQPEADSLTGENHSDRDGEATRNRGMPTRNRELIERFSDQRCLGEFPYVKEGERSDFAKLAEYAQQALNLNAILGSDAG